jgi:hypothetical protein
MKFTHDHAADLETLIHELEHGEPFAFTKFADGERLLLDRVKHDLRKPFEEWSSGEETPFVGRLRESLTANIPGYHIGISCACCGDSSGYKHGVSDQQFYLDQITMPLERVTFANVFVNGNAQRWQEWLDGKVRLMVSSSDSSHERFKVPKNAVNTDWDIDGLVSRLIELGDGPSLRAPIFVAAGPAGNIIVHEYWKRGPRNRTIVDVGSTLDPWIHGAATRGYHHPDHPNRKKVCVWSLDKNLSPAS